MGLFSSIRKALFGDESGNIKKATGQTVAGMQKGADYLQGLDAPLIDYRDKALGGLSDYYLEGDQQGFYDRAMQSPAYQNLLGAGEEAVMRNAAVTGGLRGGNVQQGLAQNSQNVLQGLVNQNLKGLQGFANVPLNSANIANIYSGIGQAQGQGTTALANYNQNLAGQTLNLATKAFGAF